MTFADDRVQEIASPDHRLDDVLFEMGACVAFKPGEEIFGQGETADLVYQLIRGSVGLSCFAFGRRHHLDTVSAPGDLFGLDPGPEHETTAEALTDCLVLIASRRGLAFVAGQAELDLLIEPASPDAPAPDQRPN